MRVEAVAPRALLLDVAPPLARREEDRALCAAKGQGGPLHCCSIYGDAAGERLREAPAMGASRPRPEALEPIAGSREMDATAILDSFAPLATRLEEQNRGRPCGW